jgi:iron complex outermembrane receptor protein
MRSVVLSLLLFAIAVANALGQTVSGTVRDAGSTELMLGASVVIKGTSIGSTTDLDGRFQFSVGDRKPPLTLVVSYIGFEAKEVQVSDLSKPVDVSLGVDAIMMKAVVVEDVRISEKQKESALTVESMDVIAIKTTPAANFYEGLGNLKGVDLTSASIGFKVINTRGFNSTSPVRSLQIIDGVDNQSPGLNFSLGNFLGASELDVLKVDLIQGASGAFYGPNAFNGVISMQSRSPFIKPGLTAQFKLGERSLAETAIRYAFVIKNKKDEDKLGVKLNLFYMQAYDWQADNMDPVYQAPVGSNNPGRFDAVNRYGDEDLTGGNDYSGFSYATVLPGLNRFYRKGYAEKDLVDYNSRNLKANMALHYKIRPDVEAIASSSFSYGTTVYQGENRFSLKDILFFQNRIEFRKEGKWFVRAYATNEDAGKSYDAVLTAFKMLNSRKPENSYTQAYINYWESTIVPKITSLPGYPAWNPQTGIDGNEVIAFLQGYQDSLTAWHTQTSEYVNELQGNGIYPYANPGTQEFDTLRNAYTSRIYTDTTIAGGGTRFYDKSALYHLHGEYKITPEIKGTKLGEITFGANGRLYMPDSKGTIFSDTAGRTITNWEVGGYVGWERKFLGEQLKASIAARVDKNQNFPVLVSPAASLVYTPNRDHSVRLSFSSAIRNPTLADQYLYYDVGRAILIGNTTGYDSLLTLDSFIEFVREGQDSAVLDFYNVAPVAPEKVKSGEVGYRGFFFGKLYADASYYVSYYTDFIGYKVGVKSEFSLIGQPVNTKVYRVATNSQQAVITQGFSIGLNYFFKDRYAINGNYSWNRLDRLGDVYDPIIPAFNTPEHKFNLGVSGRDLELVKAKNGWLGFSINYKWIKGFLFEGSPQFTGEIPTYDMVDAQISYTTPDKHVTFKLGASNLFGIQPFFRDGTVGERFENAFDNKNYQVYGGPKVGRLAYFSILLDFN